MGKIQVFETFLAKKLIFFFQFWSIFTENPLFEPGHVWKRHCDVIRWPIFMILVSMEREDPTLYHDTKQLYFGPVNFKFIRGVVTTPLVNHVTKKRLGRTRVNTCKFSWFVLDDSFCYAEPLPPYNHSACTCVGHYTTDYVQVAPWHAILQSRVNAVIVTRTHLVHVSDTTQEITCKSHPATQFFSHVSTQLSLHEHT